MIIPIKNSLNVLPEIGKQIGKPYNWKEKLIRRKFGSNGYYLREIKVKQGSNVEIPSTGSRCNFEYYEKGLLLRINDSQKLYYIPLSIDNTSNVIFDKGVEKISPFSLTHTLLTLGLKKETIKKYPVLATGFYCERFRLGIKTQHESLLLDAADSNYSKEVEFFMNSELRKVVDFR